MLRKPLVRRTTEHHMRSNVLQMELISGILLLALAMLAAACSTQSNERREPLPTAVAAVLPSDSPTPTSTATAQIKLTRTAFIATVNAQIDLTANVILTHMPTQMPTLTPVPRDTLSAPFTPIAAVMPTLTHPGTTSDDLVTLMLRQYTQAHNSNSFYFSVDIGNIFGIQVVKDAISPNWSTGSGMMSSNKTLSVFFMRPPEPANSPEATVSIEEYAKWMQARKMLIKDRNSGAVYWVKWVDHIPWRPLELEGWVTNDIFVFSQFGNPWHGFLTAIDARKHKFLLTIQLEY